MLSATIYFIGCWLKALEQNLLEIWHIYIHAMKKMFLEIPFRLPKPYIPREKHKSLLHAIGGDWYMNKLIQKLQPLKKIKLIKTLQ